MTKRTLHVAVVGQMWMGGIASQTYTLDIGGGPFQTAIDDPTNPDDIEQWLSRNTGDFASLVGVQAIYHESSTTRIDEQVSGNQTYAEDRTVSRTIEVIAFTEDQELAYGDTLRSWDDDDDDDPPIERCAKHGYLVCHECAAEDAA